MILLKLILQKVLDSNIWHMQKREILGWCFSDILQFGPVDQADADQSKKNNQLFSTNTINFKQAYCLLTTLSTIYHTLAFY